MGMLLQGKKAVVTGGSRGIGKEIIFAFLEQGASIYNIDIMDGEPGQFDEASKKFGGSVVFRKCDVSNDTEISECMKTIIKEESEGIDVLVNNAGITRDGLIFRMPTEDWDKVIRINLTSAFLVCKAASMHMSKRRKGSIINMSSVVGVGGNAGQINYSASKAGLIGLTKSLAKEIGSRGVRVNAIAPGFIQTEMTAKLPQNVIDMYMKNIPMNRLGTPAEVAQLAVFLASDMSNYITGQVIRIDGGLAI
jgi:3-oxoacyl-[acyl-carrier protein] reductase